MSSQIVGLPFGLPWWVVLPSLSAGVGSLLTFLGVRFSQTAPLQVAMNDAFRALMAEFQSDRLAHTVRISELEGEIQRLRGELRSSQQTEISLRHFVKRSGLTLPKLWTVDDED
jgi:hypothetical protein